MKRVQLLAFTILFLNVATAQNFDFPTSGNAVDGKLAPLTGDDGVTLVTSIRSTGCTPGASSNFRYGADHVSTGSIYRNTSWAAGCIGSTDIIKLDFSTVAQRPQGLRFRIHDVDNGSDSVSVLIYRGTTPMDYTYTLFASTFVTAHGSSPSMGFVGSGGNNSGLDDNRGTIELYLTDIMARVDSVIVTKYNSRNVVGNPSQSFAGFSWTNYVVLPLKILSFSAHPVQTGIDFDWIATTETGSERYQVALSADGVNFVPVGTPVAANKNAITNNYRSRIANAEMPEAAFARLQINDKDGIAKYGNIVRLNLKGQQSSTVYPVIFQSQVTLTVQSAATTKTMVMLAGMDGTIHYKQAVSLRSGSNAVALSLPQGLSAGIYRLFYRTENGSVQQHQLLKQ